MPSDEQDPTLASRGAVAEPAPELPQGSTIDRYVILEVLGRGGMGVVYKAYDSQLNRGVALKLMRSKQDSKVEESDGAARLLREAQALAQLAHPNVVAVHDVGTLENQVFVAMELVEGKTLRNWHKETKPSMNEVLEVMRAAGRGLAAAHKAGLIHRDFKPANVIVGEDGRTRVIDFGLARTGAAEPFSAAGAQRNLDDLESSGTGTESSGTGTDSSGTGTDSGQMDLADSSSQATASASARDLLSSPLTRVGSVVGTPLYMAPEQHLGTEVDARADQFSFCVALYEILYGKRPFSAESRKKLVKQVLDGKIHAPPVDSKVPKWLLRIATRGLSSKPEERYESMEELLEDLKQDPEEIRREQRAARRRKVLIAASVVLAVVLPVGVWYGLGVRATRLCKAVEGKFNGVWDGTTKDTIRKAFLSTNKPFAAGAWERVEQAFDTYTAEWTQVRAEVCEATWLRGTQSEELFDLRISCLSKRLQELGALTGVFVNADATVVGKAAQAASSLAELGNCKDEEAMRALYPPPSTPEAKAEVEAIRGKLTKVAAFAKTGKYQEGLELAKTLVKDADAVEYRPVQGETLYWLGGLLERTGDYKTAETTLYDALKAAGESRESLLAAKTMVSLVWIVGYQQARHKAGLLLGRDAWIVLALAGDDEKVTAGLFNNLGGIHRDLGKFEEARKHIEQALSSREKVLNPEHPLVAMEVNNLGQVLYQEGKYEEARQHFKRALNIKEKTLGPEHSEVGLALNNLGRVLHKLGKDEQAQQHLDRALNVSVKALDPEDPGLAFSLHDLGEFLADLGKQRQAQQYFERAVGICEHKKCDPRPNYGSQFALAKVLWQSKSDRGRARELAGLAQQGYANIPVRFDKQLAEVKDWLLKHGGE